MPRRRCRIASQRRAALTYHNLFADADLVDEELPVLALSGSVAESGRSAPLAPLRPTSALATDAGSEAADSDVDQHDIPLDPLVPAPIVGSPPQVGPCGGVVVSLANSTQALFAAQGIPDCVEGARARIEARYHPDGRVSYIR